MVPDLHHSGRIMEIKIHRNRATEESPDAGKIPHGLKHLNNTHFPFYPRHMGMFLGELWAEPEYDLLSHSLAGRAVPRETAVDCITQGKTGLRYNVGWCHLNCGKYKGAEL